MTRMDVYTSALDRQVIANRSWQNGSRRYIKIGRKVYLDEEIPSEINLLNEPDNDQWLLGGQVTKWYKVKMQISIMKKLWDSIR